MWWEQVTDNESTRKGEMIPMTVVAEGMTRVTMVPADTWQEAKASRPSGDWRKLCVPASLIAKAKEHGK